MGYYRVCLVIILAFGPPPELILAEIDIMIIFHNI